MKMLSALEASVEFALAAQRVQAVGPLIVEQACKMVHKEARRVLGTYDYGWPALASSTVRMKGKDKPGINTGEMRNSIEWTAKGNEGAVGSNNEKAVWFELGTRRQPPRSFLAGAARAMEPKIHQMAGRQIAQAAGPSHLLSPLQRYVLHGLEKAGHSLKESWETMTHDDERHDR